MGVEPFMVWLSYDGTGTAMPDFWSHLPENKAPYGRAIVPAKPDGTEGNGALLIARLKAAVEKRRIPVLMEH
jgi:3-oxosteroid 1-dehydrogenase